MSENIEAGSANLVQRLQYWDRHMKGHNTHPVFSEAADTITRLTAEFERLRAALEEIANISERPASQYPADWQEQIAACPECQRYKTHPIQRGICDTHRKPIYAQERYDNHETRILGIRAKDIARAALQPPAQEEIA